MILNSKNNNFFIEFPKTFFYKDVVNKYEFYIKRLPNPYETIKDFVNSSIQGISFPAVSLETVDQLLFDDKVKWKDGFDFKKQFEKTFTITFKSFEGYINYWIMFEQLYNFYDYDADNEFFPDMTLSLLDNTGFELIAFTFKKILMTGLSSLDLSYTSNVPDFNTFTVDFAYNYFELKRRIDE